jgi:outer membrane protein assembly factor BamA
LKHFFYKFSLILILLNWCGKDLLAQNEANTDTPTLEIQKIPEKVVINNIFIIGNEKTRKNILLRELNLKTGVEYDWEELLQFIQQDQKKIYNLLLFNSVEITPLISGDELIELLIIVSERRYILPSIIFNLADRNLAEWWTNQGRSLSRVNYGARLSNSNVGGRNEKLRIGGQLGFTKAFDVLYSFPYLDRKQRHGFSAQFNYFTNKTVALRSINNRQLFFTNDQEDVLRKNSSAFLRYTYRGSFYNFHFVTLGYNRTSIHEDVLMRNPDYFLHGDTQLNFTTIGYNYRHDKRDNIAYSTDGQLLNLGLNRYGVFSKDNFRDWEFSLIANKYHKFNRLLHVATGISANIYAGDRQPYTMVRGIGYQPNFIRGYELNVIEGQQTFVNKNSLRFTLLDLAYDISNYVPIEGFSYFPLKLYLSANYDHGFVNDKNRLAENLRLTNTYLFGYGLGLDLVTFYDMVFRVELSKNNQNESIFFFNIRAPF